jgi:hypothetical protein
MTRPNASRLTPSPMTRACRRSVVEKPRVRRTNRLRRVRRLLYLLLIVCACCVPAACCSEAVWRSEAPPPSVAGCVPLSCGGVLPKWTEPCFYRPSKSIAVDKYADDGVVHLSRCREADRLAFHTLALCVEGHHRGRRRSPSSRDAATAGAGALPTRGPSGTTTTPL